MLQKIKQGVVALKFEHCFCVDKKQRDLILAQLDGRDRFYKGILTYIISFFIVLELVVVKIPQHQIGLRALFIHLVQLKQYVFPLFDVACLYEDCGPGYVSEEAIYVLDLSCVELGFLDVDSYDKFAREGNFHLNPQSLDGFWDT